jgi:2-haloacid dehalogenase
MDVASALEGSMVRSMTARTPEAVVYDIGNVLVEWNPERFYDARYGAEARSRLFAETEILSMNERIDAGAPFRQTVHALADATPLWAEHIRLWHDHWSEMFQPAIEGSVVLLRRLRAKGVPVFALTNFGIETFALAESVYAFLSEFDRRYVSGHLGIIKPDAAIYAAVEQDCGVEPEALLFTDDRPENVAAAAARGWQTHLFDGPLGWSRKLVEVGLLTSAEADVIR